MNSRRVFVRVIYWNFRQQRRTKPWAADAPTARQTVCDDGGTTQWLPEKGSHHEDYQLPREQTRTFSAFVKESIWHSSHFTLECSRWDSSTVLLNFFCSGSRARMLLQLFRIWSLRPAS